MFCIGDGSDHSFINKDMKLRNLISFKGQWLLCVHAVCVHAFFYDVPFWFVCNHFQSWATVVRKNCGLALGVVVSLPLCGSDVYRSPETHHLDDFKFA